LGPRRPFAALIVLAFAALVAMAGVASASGGDDHGVGGRGVGGGVDVSVDRGHVEHDHGSVANGEQVGGSDAKQVGGDAIGHDQGGTAAGAEADHDGHRSTGGADAPGVNQAGGGVTASGVDIPPTPGEAPAPAASGPAPDAAGAAPIADAVVDALVITEGNLGVTEVAAPVAPGSADPVPTDSPATAPAVAAAVPDLSALAGLAQVPELRSVGAVANGVTGDQSGPRELLSTGAGRSLLMVAVLLLAIGVFISAHRWMDRGDRKLAAARSGSDVARFR
jgi:hypothetical protein